jgi:hypothetical protein
VGDDDEIEGESESGGDEGEEVGDDDESESDDESGDDEGEEVGDDDEIEGETESDDDEGEEVGDDIENEGETESGDDEGEEVEEEDTNGDESDADGEGKSEEDEKVIEVKNSVGEKAVEAIAKIAENNAESGIGDVAMQLDDLKSDEKRVDNNEDGGGYSDKEKGKDDHDDTFGESGDVPETGIVPQYPSIGPEMGMPRNPEIGGVGSDESFAGVDATKVATATGGSDDEWDVESSGGSGLTAVVAVLFVGLFCFVRMRKQRARAILGYSTLSTGEGKPHGM